jgi:hypothetical protein
MSSKFYRFVGLSAQEGRVAVRYANSVGRARHLERVGHTGVRFWDMGQAEHPMECMDQMLNLLEEGTVEFTAEERAALQVEARNMGFRLAEAV